MNKNVKKIIAFVLMICTLTASMFSCSFIENSKKNEKESNDNIACSSLDNYFPEGYTGGWGINPNSTTEYYWVETYEECVAAIELLKSHGSTFYPSVIFTCEDESFDVKYCFELDINLSENSKYGDNPFNRYVSTVNVMSVGFYDDVSVEELIYSNISEYNAFGFNSIEEDVVQKYAEKPNFIDSLKYEKSKEELYKIRDIETEQLICVLGGVENEESVSKIIESFKIIDYNAASW